jgi:hypothetical protein
MHIQMAESFNVHCRPFNVGQLDRLFYCVILKLTAAGFACGDNNGKKDAIQEAANDKSAIHN